MFSRIFSLARISFPSFLFSISLDSNFLFSSSSLKRSSLVFSKSWSSFSSLFLRFFNSKLSLSIIFSNSVWFSLRFSMDLSRLDFLLFFSSIISSRVSLLNFIFSISFFTLLLFSKFKLPRSSRFLKSASKFLIKSSFAFSFSRISSLEEFNTSLSFSIFPIDSLALSKSLSKLPFSKPILSISLLREFIFSSSRFISKFNLSKFSLWLFNFSLEDSLSSFRSSSFSWISSKSLDKSSLLLKILSESDFKTSSSLIWLSKSSSRFFISLQEKFMS